MERRRGTTDSDGAEGAEGSESLPTGADEGGGTTVAFDRPVPSKFSQTVADQKLEDKKWRMWVVQVVWVKKHNNIISILQEDNVSETARIQTTYLLWNSNAAAGQTGRGA